MKLGIQVIFLCASVYGCVGVPHERVRRNVGQFGVMMGCLLDMPTTEAGLDYNGYGCYCGFGGEGIPLDDTDRCCQSHDNCYTAVQTSDMCRDENQAYTIMYKYEANLCGTALANIRCMDSSAYEEDYEYTECAIAMCACDKAGAECFKRTRPTFNEDYVRYWQKNCGFPY